MRMMTTNDEGQSIDGHHRDAKKSSVLSRFGKGVLLGALAYLLLEVFVGWS